MKIRNTYAQRVYNYIYINDGQIFLQKEMAAELFISEPTIRKYLRWLERRNLIVRNGKRISTVPI